MEKWKSHVKEIVSEYPRYKKEIKEIEQKAIFKSASRDGQPSGGGTSDKTAMSALEHASDTRISHLRKCVEAVEHAIYIIDRSENSIDRRRIISMAYWQKTHTLYGAALDVPISERQARRWNNEFFKIVGKYMGFL